MKWKAEKWLFLVVFSDLKNYKNSRSYSCSNKAKNRVFCTFRLGLLKNLTWWSNSDPGFGFYGKNYFGNDSYLFKNKYNIFLQTCVIDIIDWIDLEKWDISSRYICSWVRRKYLDSVRKLCRTFVAQMIEYLTSNWKVPGLPIRRSQSVPLFTENIFIVIYVPILHRGYPKILRE